MTEWREAILGDLCERLTVGHVGKMADEYVEEGVPFLRSQNVRPFSISDKGMLRIGSAFHYRLRKSALKAGDVVVVRTGYPGTAAVVPRHLDNSNCADLVIITPSEELNPHMLAAVFNSSWGRSTVDGRLVGSAQKHFNVGSAASLRLRLPPRAVQDRIASVLCALGDSIESSRRRIEVLEQMARAIYREWFVRLRYPGHEDATLVDSTLGPIPEGWRIARLADVATVNRSSRKPGHGERVRYLDISCLGDRWIGPLSEVGGEEAPGRARRVVGPHDVVWSMVRPNRRAHALLVNPGPDWIASTGLAVITATKVSASFLFESVSTRAFSDYLISQEGGAAYPAVKPKDFEAAQLLVPTIEIDRRFDEMVAPHHCLVWKLREQSSRLAAMRDLLLPKLMRGEIDVAQLDLDAVEASIA